MTDANSNESYQGEDQRYHLRHGGRSHSRAATMCKFLSDAATVLDVGCNRGITSKYFLDHLPTVRVTGLEISRSTVDAPLLTHPRFQFVEANVCEWTPAERFDAVVYGAVHHHIFREKGLSEAIRVWRMLTTAARHTIFFETGHLTEGARWKWQRTIRGYFRTDEEHLHYLVRSIEERVASIEVIGKYWIHGVRRWLLKIDLTPLPDSPSADTQPNSGAPNLRGAKCFVRTFGSRNQTLYESNGAHHESPARYFRIDEPGSAPRFVKQSLHGPAAITKEFVIGSHLPHTWAVRPDSRMQDGSIVFPWIDAARLMDSIPSDSAQRRQLAGQLLAIWHDCKVTDSKCPPGPLLPNAHSARLSDVVDLNPNNFLVERSGNGLRLRMVDFEPQSDHYRWKNRIHISKMLFALRSHRARAIGLVFGGVSTGLWHLLAYEFKSSETRITRRQPALVSTAITVVRSALERILIRLFPKLDEL